MGGTRRWQHATSTRKNLPLEMMTKFVMPASGKPCTTNVQYPAKYTAGTVLQVRHRNRQCLSIEISIGAPS